MVILPKLMITALLLLQGHAITSPVEWGVEADNGKLHLYCDDKTNSVRIPLNSDTQFVAHTHPAEDDPHPSANDIRVAKRTQMYDLVVSPHGAYLVHPDGIVEKLDLGKIKSK